MAVAICKEPLLSHGLLEIVCTLSAQVHNWRCWPSLAEALKGKVD
jgi:cAMP phosphodiesterase